MMTHTQYVARRNALIPEAVRHADKEAAPFRKEGRDHYGTMWNQAFFRKMNELAKAEGLT